MEKRTVNLEIRSADSESRKIEGYAAVFNEEYTQLKDRWGDVFYEKISAGAFKKTLADDKRDKFMLINHDWNKVIGRTGSNLTLSEDEHGLRFEVDVPNTVDGNDLLENVRLGLIKGCSFGFNIKDQITRWDDNWTFYRDITEVELFEVTATPIPAYNDTEIACRSELSIRDIKPQQDPIIKKKINKRNVDLMSTFLNSMKIKED